jgi:hypothetical protein
MLYGERYAYENGVLPYEATDLRFGVVDVTISGVQVIDDVLYVTGSNFTEFSRIKINDRIYETVIVSDSELMLLDTDSLPSLRSPLSVSVAQVNSVEKVLTETEVMLVDLSSYLNRRGGGIFDLFY